MVKLNIGLTFAGQCEQAFLFYKSVFGGGFTSFIRYGDDPTTNAATPEKDKAKMAYVALPVGDVTLYGDDTLESSGIKVVGGNNVAVSVHPESKEEADRLFGALAGGGTKILPIAEFPWGYCGMLIDKFGVKWVVWVQAISKEA